MPRRATVVQVFVASPSDVNEERKALEGVVEELNQTWSQNLGVFLELIKWETHVRPGFGSEPQAVIDRQVGNQYDVFIGILWSRFGSATKEFDSGTEQEFGNALTRFQETGSPEIMIYFKTKNVNHYEVDLEQLAKIKKFKERISGEGGLYSLYESDTEFLTSVRSHLASIVQHFASKVDTEETVPQETVGLRSHSFADRSSGESEEFGYLDYVDIYNAKMAIYTDVLNSITDATKRIASQFRMRALELRELNASGADTKAVRRTLSKSASDMQSYSEVLELQSPLLKSARESSLNALSMALAVYQEFDATDKEELEVLKKSMSKMKDAIDGSRHGLIEFSSSIGGIPRMTADLNKARREVTRNLDTVLVELEATKRNVKNILEAIDQMLR